MVFTRALVSLPNKWKDSNGLRGWRLAKINRMVHTTPCAMMVAMAAPRMPHPKPNIIRGSKIMLIISPAALAQKPKRELPAPLKPPVMEADT